jgi:hypothetical protein
MALGAGAGAIVATAAVVFHWSWPVSTGLGFLAGFFSALCVRLGRR